MFPARYFNLKFKKNNSGEVKLYLAVSKKVSNKATVRNLLKRRMREIFKKNSAKIKGGHDLIFIFTPWATKLSFKELEEEIFSALQGSRLLK